MSQCDHHLPNKYHTKQPDGKLRKQCASSFEFVARQSGTWFEIRVYPSPEGGVSVYFRDVSERKRMEEKLIQTGKLAALGQLLVGVAHEINNPLAAIGGLAQLLQMHPADDVRDDAIQIADLVHRINRIVYSLRRFSRSQSTLHNGLPNGSHPDPGDYTLNGRVEDLNRIVSLSLEVIGQELRRGGVTLDLQLATGLPPIKVRPGEIEQVLVNLLANAAQALAATPENARKVTITTANGCDRELPVVRLIVTDNGPGIAEDVINNIFDPFFTTKEIGDGTGLGLYISHMIINSHGGTIRAKSTFGEGATFSIDLPCAARDGDGGE